MRWCSFTYTDEKCIVPILKDVVSAAGSLWFDLSFLAPIAHPTLSSLHAGLTLCHWETEGNHRAGGQDSASGVGQCWQDHPAEEPRLWGCEHHHTNTGEKSLCVENLWHTSRPHYYRAQYNKTSQQCFSVCSSCNKHLSHLDKLFCKYFINQQVTSLLWLVQVARSYNLAL